MDKTADLDLSADLARRLKAARALIGMRVRDYASRLGWSEEKVYRLERGDQVPDALELAAIAQLTGQPLEFFFGASSAAGERVLPPPLPVGQEADSA